VHALTTDRKSTQSNTHGCCARDATLAMQRLLHSVAHLLAHSNNQCRWDAMRMHASDVSEQVTHSAMTSHLFLTTASADDQHEIRMHGSDASDQVTHSAMTSVPTEASISSHDDSLSTAHVGPV
jgi:hypothetical protein